MKIVSLSRFGGPEVLSLAEQPMPEPGPGQILIKVAAAGINFADILSRQNLYAVTPPLPSVPGSEVAGTVAELGSGVRGLAVGQRVAGPLFAIGRYDGGYAEYAVIDAAYAVPLPDGVGFAEANALMVQGLTAYYLLRQAPAAGKSVLVTAAAGGVGSILVQLAKRAGASKVVAVAGSPEKLDFARSLGAEIAISYRDADWSQKVRDALGGTGPDVIYDSVGGDITREGLKLLAPLGQMVIFGALNIQDFQLNIPDLLGLIFNNQSLTGFAVAPLLDAASLRRSLDELFGLVLSGELKVTIGGAYPLAEVAEAHRAVESRSTIGKVVLQP